MKLIISSILLPWAFLEISYTIFYNMFFNNIQMCVAFVCNISQIFCSYWPLIKFLKIYQKCDTYFDDFSNEEMNETNLLKSMVIKLEDCDSGWIFCKNYTFSLILFNYMLEISSKVSLQIVHIHSSYIVNRFY